MTEHGAARDADDSDVEQAPFVWRSEVGYWRWLLLGTLGFTVSACGGSSDGGESGLAGGQGLAGEPGLGANGIVHRRTLGAHSVASSSGISWARPRLRR